MKLGHEPKNTKKVEPQKKITGSYQKQGVDVLSQY